MSTDVTDRAAEAHRPEDCWIYCTGWLSDGSCCQAPADPTVDVVADEHDEAIAMLTEHDLSAYRDTLTDMKASGYTANLTADLMGFSEARFAALVRAIDNSASV